MPITSSIVCPTCGEKNEAARTYCWVCYQRFDQAAPATAPIPPPPHASARAKILNGISRKPKHSLASDLVMIIGGMMVLGALLVVGFYGFIAVLLAVTCPGGSGLSAEMWQRVFVASLVALGGGAIMALSKSMRSNL